MTDKVIEGEPLYFDLPALKLVCCGCGLTHLIVLDERDGVPKLCCYRDDYKTKEEQENDK